MYEAPSVTAPRSAAGPVLMPPAVTEPSAKKEAVPMYPVRPPKPTGHRPQDNWQASEVPPARVRPSSISRLSPHPPTPQAETSADAVSQLFMKLETYYANPPVPSEMVVRSQEPSYGPGYRQPTHGAVVRQQEPYPVEVHSSVLLLTVLLLEKISS